MHHRKCLSVHTNPLCLLTVLLTFAPFLLVSQAQSLPPEVLRYADMVLYNGQVLTMDRDQPPINVTQAVAVRDGRILAVGEDDRILKMAGPDTVRVDLEGKAVVPGFVDTHSHPNSYALRHYRDEYTPLYLKALEDNHVHFARIRWDSVETAQADFKRFAEDLPPDIYAAFQESFENFHRRSYFRTTPRQIRNSKIAARQFIDANVVLGMGTDSGSPTNFHTESAWREISALVDSGMTPIQAISAATKTGAEILGRSNERGTIEAGKRADIIVVNGNPLFDINVLGYVERVIKGGVVYK